MRWVGLAIIFAAIPLIVAYLGQGVRRRDQAVMVAGLLMFCTGPLQIEASLIAWPAWQGISKGIIMSLLDSLSIALLVTRQKGVGPVPLKWLLVVFAIPIAVSVVQAPVKQPSFFIVFQMAQMMAFFVAFGRELQRPSAVRSLMKGLALGLMVQAGYVIWQKLHGMVQAPGTTPHQNILGIMVELGALPLFAAVLEGERSKLVYAGLIAALIVIAGGGSRGAMLYLAVGLVTILLLSLMRRTTARKWKVVGMGIMAGFIMVPLGFATLKDRFGDTPITSEEEQRAAFERAARQMATDHPLGVGANNFVTVNNMQGYAERAGLTWGSATRSKPAHNAYLLARAETGWAGEISLILLLGGVGTAGLLAGFKMKKAPYMGLPLGPTGAIFAVGLHSNYEYAFYLAETQRLFFMDAAVIAAFMVMISRAGAERRRQMREAKSLTLEETPAVADGVVATEPS